GKHLGRKKGDTPKMKILYANKRKLVREHQRGESCAELARQMGVSRTTMFRFLRHY
ncbi:MAG TPA: invertase, partial [Bacteroides uniformis]|nr:invertase [Bacteroides uniformis]